jgi:putative endonuclease
MPSSRQRYGRKSEAHAARHLQTCGYVILEKNYRTQHGEIDIIAEDSGVIVFVEVKARKTESFGNPKGAVTEDKQRKISMVALQYLKSTGQLAASARFDVVAVHPSDGCERIEVVKNAFELAYR